jgi:3-methyladenine DNA glycosylase AlkD
LNVKAQVRAFARGFRAAGKPERAEFEKGYHKSALSFHGVDAKTIRTAAATFKREHKQLDHDELIALVDALWASRYFDLRSVALELLTRYGKLLTVDDGPLLERLLRESKGWAHVDWLSTSIVGPLVERNPKLEKTLKRWSRDDDFWIRRASMLSLLRPLRRAEGNFELFAVFAARMIEEKEFFIRKAIGWVLREVSKKRPALAYGFLDEHVDVVAGLTLREGSKYLPQRQRDSLVKRYKGRDKR